MIAALDLPDRRDWTVKDLASLPEDLDYELIHGRLILPPSPLPLHQFLGLETGFALEVNCPDDVLVGVHQSVRIDFRNEPRPDVVLIREEGAARTPVLSADVLLAVEIVSPESINRDRDAKLEVYAYGGIRHYWIVDPTADTVTFTEYQLTAGAYERHVSTDGVVDIERPWPVTLDLPAWTRRRDRLGRVARPVR